MPDKVKEDIGMQVKREGEFWSVVSRVNAYSSFSFVFIQFFLTAV